MSGFYYGGAMKVCQGEGCTNQLPAAAPHTLCPACITKRDGPSADERQNALYEQFRELRFTESEARKLAAVWADPTQISWWLEQGCGHRRAVEIAT